MKTKSIIIKTTKNQEGEVSATYNGKPITAEEVSSLNKSLTEEGYDVTIIIEPVL